MSEPQVKNIVLIGFMAAGKSSVAQALSKRLNRPLLATDKLIEERLGKNVRQIFEERGEAYFRSIEGEVVAEVSAMQGVIIDCGGGVVLNQKNFEILKRNGMIFHLHAPPEVIFGRIKGHSNRPLLNVPDPLARIRELYNQRLPLYNQADVTVDSSSASIELPVDEILKRI
jgi:shikimate kinase